MKIFIQDVEFENDVCKKEADDIFQTYAASVRDSHLRDYFLWYHVEQQMLKIGNIAKFIMS